MTLATVTVLDLLILCLLRFTDLLMESFLFTFKVPILIKTAGYRFFRRAFRTRTDRSEFHLALITTLVSLILLHFNEPRGGRDVLLTSIGLYISLDVYAFLLLSLSLILHLGMFLESYLIRCIGVWLLTNYLTFTAGILVWREYKSLLPWIYLFIAYVAQGVYYKIEHTDEKGDSIR